MPKNSNDKSKIDKGYESDIKRLTAEIEWLRECINIIVDKYTREGKTFILPPKKVY